MPRDFFLFVCTCVYHVLNWQLQTFMHLSYNLVVWSLIWALRLLCKQNQKEPSWKHPRKCPSKWICCLAFALLLFVKQSSEIQFDLFNYLFSVDFIRQIAEFKWRNESNAFAKMTTALHASVARKYFINGEWSITYTTISETKELNRARYKE